MRFCGHEAAPTMLSSAHGSLGGPGLPATFLFPKRRKIASFCPSLGVTAPFIIFNLIFETDNLFTLLQNFEKLQTDRYR